MTKKMAFQTGFTNYQHEACAFEVELMDKAEEYSAEENALDELGQVLLNPCRDNATALESKKFEKMLEDHEKWLYLD